ncbi:MAG: sterol desaturase family protein [Pseudomonadota bacterium]
MESIESQFEAYSGSFAMLELVGGLFLLLIIFETVWDLVTRTRTSIKETAANYVIAGVNLLLERTVFGLAFIAGLFLASYFAAATAPVTWWTWLLAILMADFCYYWMHRCEHSVRLLWAYHSVHHSSPEFNLSTSLRLSWFEGAFEWVFFVPMILLGFSVPQTLVAILVVVTYQTWIHTERVGKIAWLEGVINTPSAHRVHHASNKQFHDKNFGGILMIWDRLFGTYERETAGIDYGITTPIGSANPITINCHEFLSIAKDAIRANRWRDAVAYIFKGPGWQPEIAPKEP